MGEIDIGRSPINLVPVDVGTIHVHRSPADIKIILIPEGHVNAVTVPILENRFDTETVCVHTNMLTRFQTLRGAIAPKYHYGCYELHLTQSR